MYLAHGFFYKTGSYIYLQYYLPSQLWISTSHGNQYKSWISTSRGNQYNLWISASTITLYIFLILFSHKIISNIQHTYIFILFFKNITYGPNPVFYILNRCIIYFKWMRTYESFCYYLFLVHFIFQSNSCTHRSLKYN